MSEKGTGLLEIVITVPNDQGGETTIEKSSSGTFFVRQTNDEGLTTSLENISQDPPVAPSEEEG